MQVKKQQLEQDMEQQTGSKLGKEYVKAVYGHPAYLTCMKSTSCEMPDWMQAHPTDDLLCGFQTEYAHGFTRWVISEAPGH